MHKSPKELHKVILALGSNIEKEQNLPLALAFIRDHYLLKAVAPIYETVPMGLTDQPLFWNTAVLIETPLSPAEIKRHIIGAVETRLHRVRQADPNAPRTIDADIILYDDEILDYAGEDGRLRHIPDPDLTRFAHVAVPVADLLPQMHHPETGEQLIDIATRLRATDPDAIRLIQPNPPFRA